MTTSPLQLKHAFAPALTTAESDVHIRAHLAHADRTETFFSDDAVRHEVKQANHCADLRKRTSPTSETALGGRCKIDANRTQYNRLPGMTATATRPEPYGNISVARVWLSAFSRVCPVPYRCRARRPWLGRGHGRTGRWRRWHLPGRPRRPSGRPAERAARVSRDREAAFRTASRVRHALSIGERKGSRIGSGDAVGAP